MISNEYKGIQVAQIDTSEARQGAKIEVDGQPYLVVLNQFVKPGKGNAFNRMKLKHLLTGRVIERTFKSGEKFDVADVNEAEMRLLYTEPEGAVFMDDKSFEQITIPLNQMGDTQQWLKEDILYTIIFYQGRAVTVEPPTFMELRIVDTSPGVRGDTASGRVMKPAKLETGAEIQVPIFVDQDELIRVDTRTAEYDSRVKS